MRIKITKLNHVQLSMPKGEEGAVRKFFGEILGLEEIEKPDALKPNGGIWYKIAGIQLHLGLEEKQERTKRHPAFEVRELRKVRAYLEGHGVEVREETAVPGMNRFSFFDPFGNRIEFIETTKPKIKVRNKNETA